MWFEVLQQRFKREMQNWMCLLFSTRIVQENKAASRDPEWPGNLPTALIKVAFVSHKVVDFLHLAYCRNEDASLSPRSVQQTRRASVRVHVRARWIGARGAGEREGIKSRASPLETLSGALPSIYKWVITVWKGNKGGWHTAVGAKKKSTQGGEGMGAGRGRAINIFWHGRASATVLCIIIVTAVSLVLMAIRLYARVRHRRRPLGLLCRRITVALLDLAIE